MNPILAVVKGTTNTIQEGAKAAGQAALRGAVPSPTESLYKLGMGLGPLLRNIVEEINKKDSPASKSPAVEKESAGFQKKDIGLLSSQFNVMISVLKDIRSIGMLQLKNEQLKAFEAKRGSILQKESEAESLAQRPFLSVLTQSKTGEDSKSNILSTISDMIPSIVKIAGIALGGKWVWDNLITDDIKNDIKNKLKTKYEEITDFIGKSLLDVIKSNPLESAIAGLFLAKITGILGAIGFVGKLGYKGAEALSKAAGTLGATSAASAAAATAATSTTAATKPSSTTTTATGWEQRKQLLLQGIDPSKVEPEAKPTSSMLSKAGKVASTTLKGLPLVGTVASGYQASEDYKEGKNISASLNALSALLSAGTAASLVSGVGAPLAPFMAGGALVTGLAGTLASYFETPSKTAGLETAPPTATPSPSMEKGPSEDMIQKLSEALGARESSNRLNAENEFGYIGKYQFGVQALETLGYLKKGATEQMNRLGGAKSGGQQKVLNDPSMWKIGNKEEFMRNPEMQERAFKQLLKFNYDLLESKKLINKDSTKEHVAGLLSAMHLGGLGGVQSFLSGKTTRDAFGTSVAEYYQLGHNAEAGIINHVSRQNLDSSRNQNALMLDELTRTLGEFMTAATFGPVIDQSQNISLNGSAGDSYVAPPPQTASRIGDATRHTR